MLGAGELTVTPGAVISGSLTANKSALLRLCGARITGPVEAINGSGPVVIGEGTASCPGNTITGPVTVKGNTAGVKIIGNTVAGSLTVTGNAGGTTVIINSISKDLTITGNTGTVVDKPNTVKGKSKLQ